MLVSIIIPAFNAAEWIPETIGSVVRQTYQDLEVIVIDDGSTDGTAEIADKTLRSGKFPYRILRQSNGGVSAARNRGWKSARGVWAQFLDTDDLLDPGKIELQVQRSLTCAASVIYSDWQKLIWERGAWAVEEKIRRPSIGLEPIADILGDANFMQLGSQLIRIDVLEAANGFDEAHWLVEDVELSLKIAMANGIFARAPSRGPVFWYRDRPRSLSKSNQDQFVEACLRNARLVDRYARERKLNSPTIVDAIVDVYFSGARYFAGRDWGRFEAIVAEIEELRPAFVPRAPTRLMVLSRVAGYRNAERLATLYGKGKSFGSALCGTGGRRGV
jgi:glycosyltransferase involved in cell wall biosynthesis